MTAVAPARVLVVCTGNICRSPYIAHLLQHDLDQVWGQGQMIVSSAGTHGLVGEPISPGSGAQLRSRDHLETDFRARRLAVADVSAADLVIVATREHRAAVLRTCPAALRRTATLVEVAMAASIVPPLSRDLPDLSAGVRGVAAAVVAHRPSLVDVPPATFDLDDPYRKDAAAYERMAVDVDRWLPAVVRALSPADAT